MKKYYCIDCKKEIGFGHKRCKSCENKRRHRLGIIGNKGKIFNDDWRNKIGIANQGDKNSHYIDGRTLNKYYCLDCGIEVSDYRIKRCQSCANRIISSNRKGELASNWLGGKSFEPYSFEFNEQLKKLIRIRDNYTCQNCKKYGKHIHHINYNKTDCNKNNLITLCIYCHNKTNFNRDFWKKVLKDKVTSMEKLNDVRLIK
jgi:DNA-directed RNA polymerase subunit RPC12/RpoP